MAAFDFPASPTDGQTYTPAGSSVTYTYSNAAKVWKAVTPTPAAPPTFTAGRVLLGDGTSTPATDAELTYDATKNNLSVGGTVVMGSAYGFRNKLINGDFRIAQRGATWTGAFSNARQYRSVDRWYAVNCTTFSQVADAPAGFAHSLEFGTSTTDAPYAIQRIEGANMASMAGKKGVISFWAKQTAGAGPFGISFVRPGSLDTYGADVEFTPFKTVTVTNTWAHYSVVADFPAEIGFGFQLSISCGASGTARITGVQLEEGEVATPFEHRPIGLELSLCQRYYEKMPAGFDIQGSFGDNVHSRALWIFKVAKRVIPTCTNQYALHANPNASVLMYGCTATAASVPAEIHQATADAEL